MTIGILIWLIIFTVASLLFFGIAAIIAVLGMRDLRLLLSKSETLDRPNPKMMSDKTS
jgi:hypothetical protein